MKRGIDALTDETFDLAIIGGGITGAGVAFDAATRGWRVALIDKGDFACATSSASSKLIHGGLRYLEQAEFGLVHEALHERRRLLMNAPHLVQPLPFILPFYEQARVAPWKWRLGLTLYDLLAGRANLRRSRPLSESTLRGVCPDLRRSGRRGGALYYDAQMDDARLCLAVLQSAARHGAVLANYVEATGFERRAGIITGLHVRDAVSRRDLLIRARQVLNATGPWVDEMCQRAGEDAAHLEPTKGIHLITPPRGEHHAYLLLHPRDGRVFFVIPWYGKTLIGTTDTFPESGPDKLEVRPDEVEYLLEGYNHHFAPGLEPAQVLGTFAGLRPLIRGKAGTPSSLSREYEVFVAPDGLVSVAGGKYTTFRQMAEDITDRLARLLRIPGRCRTRTLRLVGTPAEPWPRFVSAALAAVRKQVDVSPEAAEHLVRRYGSRVFDVLAHVAGAAQRIHPDEPDLVGELAYQRAEEMALFPADHFLRRSRIGLWRPELLRSAHGRRDVLS